MKVLFKLFFIIIQCVCAINLCVSPGYSKDLATGTSMDNKEASDKTIGDAQKDLTAEELKQTIPLEDTILAGVSKEDLFESYSEYTLGFQDVIEVEVLRHPEVSGQYLINAEGDIQYEFVGDIKIAGMKKDEVKKVLADNLSNYIINPEVTVKITGYNSKIVYVVGEVGAPGKIFMRGDTITVREALVQAGLPLLSGKLKEAKVITPDETGKANVKKVNVHNLLYKGDLRENIVMKPGDTLYIPPTFLAKTMRIISPVAAPITTGAGAARTVYAPGF